MYWKCKCDCGSEKIVIATTGGIRYGNPKSCGCLQREWARKFNKTKIVDISGKRFGSLTAIRENGRTKSGQCVWLCNCDCGNERNIPQGDLSNGSRISCGCKQFVEVSKTGKKYGGRNYIDIVGQTFGYLQVLYRVEDIFKKPEFICKCLLCGNLHQAQGKLLKNGHILSCGCLRSYGEQKISEYLGNNNFKFKAQFWFDDLRTSFSEVKPKGFPLRFDFAVFNNDEVLMHLIEFDGKQHFEPVNFNKCSEENAIKSHKNTRENDNLKNEYCKKNSINLIRIKYTEMGNIEQILDKELNT